MLTRCASGSCAKAVISATWSGSSSGCATGVPCRRHATPALRIRRHRLTARRRETVRTHASGDSRSRTVDHRSHARSNASWVTSSASAASPVSSTS